MRLLLLLLATALAQAQTGSVEGTVVNSVTGEVVPHAAVLLVVEGKDPEPVFTDGEGRFRIEGLVAGRYVLRARKRGYLEAREGGEAALRVTVEAGRAKGGLVVKLRPYGVISGRVFDEYGEPAEGATVNVCVPRRNLMNCQVGTEANDRGEYRLTGLAPGAYVVVGSYAPPRGLYPAAANGRREAYAPTFYPQGVEPSSAQRVEVSAGAETAGIDVRMLKVPLANVRGRVVGPYGEGVKSFKLSVAGADFRMWTNAGTRTGDDGVFEVSNLAPGAWRVFATVREPGTDPVSGSAAVVVNGQDVEGLLVRIPASVPVTGNLVLEGGGMPDWSRSKVYLVPVDLAAGGTVSRAAKLSKEGSFTIEAPPGRYRVGGEEPPGAYLASVRLGANEVREREVDLTAGASVALTVIYRTDGATLRCAVQPGDTVREVNVVLLPAEEALRRSGLVRVEGLGTGTETEFKAVRPGEYLVAAVEDGDYGSLWQGEIPQAVLDAAVKLRLEPRGSHHVMLKPVKAR